MTIGMTAIATILTGVALHCANRLVDVLIDAVNKDDKSDSKK